MNISDVKIAEGTLTDYQAADYWFALAEIVTGYSKDEIKTHMDNEYMHADIVRASVNQRRDALIAIAYSNRRKSK